MTCWVTGGVPRRVRATPSIRSKWTFVTRVTLTPECICVYTELTHSRMDHSDLRGSSRNVPPLSVFTPVSDGEKACLLFFTTSPLSKDQSVSQQELELYTERWPRRVGPLSPSLIMALLLTPLRCACAALYLLPGAFIQRCLSHTHSAELWSHNDMKTRQKNYPYDHNFRLDLRIKYNYHHHNNSRIFSAWLVADHILLKERGADLKKVKDGNFSRTDFFTFIF